MISISELLSYKRASKEIHCAKANLAWGIWMTSLGLDKAKFRQRATQFSCFCDLDLLPTIQNQNRSELIQTKPKMEASNDIIFRKRKTKDENSKATRQ
jgi:hypothetical protein